MVKGVKNMWPRRAEHSFTEGFPRLNIKMKHHTVGIWAQVFDMPVLWLSDSLWHLKVALHGTAMPVAKVTLMMCWISWMTVCPGHLHGGA